MPPLRRSPIRHSHFLFFLFWHLSLDLCHFGWQNTLLILSWIWHHRQFLSLFSSTSKSSSSSLCFFFLLHCKSFASRLNFYLYIFSHLSLTLSPIYFPSNEVVAYTLSSLILCGRCIIPINIFGVIYLASSWEQSKNSFVWIDRSLRASTHTPSAYFEVNNCAGSRTRHDIRIKINGQCG